MHTVPTMHVICVVHCWVNMKPLNRIQPTNFQLCSNQSINQPQFLVWGERVPKNTFAPSPHICRSVPAYSIIERLFFMNSYTNKR